MSYIKLIYFEGCPNAESARIALFNAGVDFEVIKQNELPNESPFRRYSSPSILRGESELICGFKTNTSACSFGEINVDDIQSKLMKKAGSQGFFASFGSIGSGLVVGLCPICIPAIGTFLASIGLGALVTIKVLEPLLIGLLFIAISGLYQSYRKEHGRLGPLVLGSVMALAMYIGKYVYFNNLFLIYGSIPGLIGATVWNLKLRNKVLCGACPKK